jgi:hypothetical protein
MAIVGDVPLTPIIDTVTGSVTEIGRIWLRNLATNVSGFAPLDASYWTSRSTSILTGEVNLGALPSGYLTITTAIGMATPATVPTIPVGDVTGLAAALAGKANVIHAPTHAPGGADPIIGAAWLAQANVFTQTPQTITNAARPELRLIESSQAVDQRVFRIVNATGVLYLQAINDAITVASGGVMVDRTGSLTVGNLLTATGFGGHVFSAAGTGSNLLQVRNTAAGTGNVAGLWVGNNLSATHTLLQVFASTFTSGGINQADGGTLVTTGAGGLSIATTAASPLRLYTSNAERLRIAPTGEILIGIASNPAAGHVVLSTDLAAHQGVLVQNTNAGAIGVFAYFLNNVSGAAGSISHATATTVSYNTSSDARLKDDAGRATDLAALRAVVVHDFTWKADGTRARGVFAQEAAACFPTAITPGTDATTAAGALAHPWMTDYSKFVPDLIVGWQAHETALEAIAALRAELADLRARLEDRRSEHGAL